MHKEILNGYTAKLFLQLNYLCFIISDSVNTHFQDGEKVNSIHQLSVQTLFLIKTALVYLHQMSDTIHHIMKMQFKTFCGPELYVGEELST